jgi:hypothetical protein
VRTDKALIVRSIVFAVGIPRLQAGEDVKKNDAPDVLGLSLNLHNA